MIDHRFISYHNLIPTIDLFFYYFPVLRNRGHWLVVDLNWFAHFIGQRPTNYFRRPGSSKFQRVLPVGFQPKSEFSMDLYPTLHVAFF
jgi:hypothetical protein